MDIAKLKSVVNSLIYLSVVLGIVLLAQIYFLVPSWLFYSVLAGWFAYVLVAFAAANRHSSAYPAAFVLAMLTLVVSLPQPEHYSFASEGMLIAIMTFATGSALQIALLILIPIYLIKTRKSV